MAHALRSARHAVTVCVSIGPDGALIAVGDRSYNKALTLPVGALAERDESLALAAWSGPGRVLIAVGDRSYNKALALPVGALAERDEAH